MSISLSELENALRQILDSPVTSVESNEHGSGSLATNASDADFFLKEANTAFQSMGSVFEWLGQKLAGVEPTTQESASQSVTINTASEANSTLTASVAESYASMVKSYTTLIVEAKSAREKSLGTVLETLNTELAKIKNNTANTISISISEDLKKVIQSNNTTISSVNSTIQTSIDQLSEDEMDHLARPSSLATSVKTQLSKKEFMEGLLLPVMRPKLQRIQVLMEDMDSSIDTDEESTQRKTVINNIKKSKDVFQTSLLKSSASAPAPAPAPATEVGSMQSSSTGSSIDSQPIHILLFELELQRNQLLKRLLDKSSLSASLSESDSASLSASSPTSEPSPISSQLLVFKKDGITSLERNSSATYTPSAPNIRFHKNLKKAVAVAASMIIDVNNIFISIGQHIIGEDDTLGGAIFFKLDKDGTVLEQLHSAIFKDSNEYDKFVTLAGGDRNNLWTKNDTNNGGDLTGKIQYHNIPPEVAKLRHAVRRTQKNTAAAATTDSTNASANASAVGGNNTTKKYYKRATRTKRPRRLGRRTR